MLRDVPWLGMEWMFVFFFGWFVAVMFLRFFNSSFRLKVSWFIFEGSLVVFSRVFFATLCCFARVYMFTPLF